MKVAIVSVQVPFVRGGAEVVAEALTEKCRELGHEPELIRMPFSEGRLLEQMLAARLLRVGGAELVVALKFPGYYTAHGNKVLWLLHQFRQAYDLWGTQYQGLLDTPEATEVRRAIIRADNVLLREARRVYTISGVVADRLRRYNGIEAQVLYPPLVTPDRYRCDSFDDYIFCPSRINRPKRQLLAIESMRYTRSSVRLIIAGPPNTPEELAEVMAAVRMHRLEERVQVVDRWISEEEKARLFAGALGCLFIPYDEDYGIVTLESFQSRKPVITCQDSGGPLEFVADGISGFVVPPEPQRLADAMDDLMADRAKARRMGEAGYETLQSLHMSWASVVERLTG